MGKKKKVLNKCVPDTKKYKEYFRRQDKSVLHIEKNVRNEAELRNRFYDKAVDHPYFLSSRYGIEYKTTVDGINVGIIFDKAIRGEAKPFQRRARRGVNPICGF